MKRILKLAVAVITIAVVALSVLHPEHVSSGGWIAVGALAVSAVWLQTA